MAVITDLNRGVVPDDFNGRITVQDIVDTVGGGGGTGVLGTQLTGYTVAATESALSATDTLLVAIGKLEKRIVELETP